MFMRNKLKHTDQSKQKIWWKRKALKCVGFKTEMQQPCDMPKRLPNKNVTLDSTNIGNRGVKVEFGLLYSRTETIIVFIVI